MSRRSPLRRRPLWLVITLMAVLLFVVTYQELYSGVWSGARIARFGLGLVLIQLGTIGCAAVAVLVLKGISRLTGGRRGGISDLAQNIKEKDPE